jgi:DNA-binding NarL/FixJ family response regulator
MSPYRIVLTDDHVLLRQGLRRIIEGVGDLEVVGEAGNGLELLRLLRECTPHLVVLDISMPNLRGIETIPEIKAIHPQVKVLVLTMHRDRGYLVEAMSAGADGYLLKEDADTQVFSAVEKVRQGKVYVSPKLGDEVAATWALACRGDLRPAAAGERLTLREREVLKFIAEGQSAKEIADVLCISHRTVEHHRANMMAKLNLKGTAELVKYAIANGYL